MIICKNFRVYVCVSPAKIQRRIITNCAVHDVDVAFLRNIFSHSIILICDLLVANGQMM